MQNPGRKPTVCLRPTEEQGALLRRATGRDGEELELRIEALEERIAPRLAANHNETMLVDA